MISTTAYRELQSRTHSLFSSFPQAAAYAWKAYRHGEATASYQHISHIRWFRLRAFLDMVLQNHYQRDKSSLRNKITAESWHLQQAIESGATTRLVHRVQMENKSKQI